MTNSILKQTQKSQLRNFIKEKYDDDLGAEFNRNLEELLKFTNENLMKYNDYDSLMKIFETYGMRNALARTPELYRGLSMIVLDEFLKANSLDYEFLEKDSFQKEQIADSPKTYKVTESYGVSMSVAGGSQQYETNHCITPTFDKFWKTGHAEIDNYIKYSIIFKFNYENFNKMTKFQKLSLIQLSQYLSKKSAYISQAMKGLVGSRYKRGNQYILGDYIENFIRFNSDKATKLSQYKIIPYMIELNGKPGIGKSTFVDFLCEMMHRIFPFYDEQDAIYNRVNDKFWNGYKQQPVVLYDDQNQNRELRYNLDNEIIQLGSGQFVHPPMAFEKSTKFSSLFVVFTTNKRILETTKVNKGAISRRVKTYFCEPLKQTGNYVSCEIEGEKWVYDENVFLNPFNLEFNNNQFTHVIFDFLSNMTGQRSLQFEKKVLFFYFDTFNRKIKKSLEEELNDFQFVEASSISESISKGMNKRFKQLNLVSELRIDGNMIPFPIKEYGIKGLACLPDTRIKVLDSICQQVKNHFMFMDRENFSLNIKLENNHELLFEKEGYRVCLAKMFGNKCIGIYNYDMNTRTYAMNVDTATAFDSWTAQIMSQFLLRLQDFYNNRGQFMITASKESTDAEKMAQAIRASFYSAVGIFGSIGELTYCYQ